MNKLKVFDTIRFKTDDNMICIGTITGIGYLYENIISCIRVNCEGECIHIHNTENVLELIVT